VALVFLDIDHFKAINDRFGHETGDRVLQQLSARLRGLIRETDLLFRWGGEEFVVLMPHTGRARRACSGSGSGPPVAERPFAATEARPRVPVTVSVGVAFTSSWAGRPGRAAVERRRRLLPGQGARPKPGERSCLMQGVLRRTPCTPPLAPPE
jgi:diguanylate cyclase (GGDEF)-like protein